MPGCSARAGLSEACSFSATGSGEYICTGNAAGDVRVYDTHNGKQVALVSPIKVCRSRPSMLQLQLYPGSQLWNIICSTSGQGTGKLFGQLRDNYMFLTSGQGNGKLFKANGASEGVLL